MNRREMISRSTDSIW